jgi:hypothetical protein
MFFLSLMILGVEPPPPPLLDSSAGLRINHEDLGCSLANPPPKVEYDDRYCMFARDRKELSRCGRTHN